MVDTQAPSCHFQMYNRVISDLRWTYFIYSSLKDSKLWLCSTKQKKVIHTVSVKKPYWLKSDLAHLPEEIHVLYFSQDQSNSTHQPSRKSNILIPSSGSCKSCCSSYESSAQEGGIRCHSLTAALRRSTMPPCGERKYNSKNQSPPNQPLVFWYIFYSWFLHIESLLKEEWVSRV